MLQYELFYLVGESKDQNMTAIKAEVEKMVVAQGGIMQEGEMEERRKLAYSIQKETRGTYVTKRFALPDTDERVEGAGADAIALLTRQLHLYRDIIRFIIVRAETLPVLGERENVPQLQRADKGHRDARGGAHTPVADPRAYSRPAVQVTEAPIVESKAPVETAKAAETTEAPKKVESVVEPTQEEKKSVEEPAKVEMEKAEVAEPVVEKPKKRVSKKAKSEEDEIDKKLDEILNI